MEIRKVKNVEIEEVSHFLIRTMGAVYPFPLSASSLRDLTEMDSLFLSKAKATFLAAFENGKIVGTIAVRPYDGRIISLGNRYNLNTTCEIIKCYVDQSLRRQGIGSLLFGAAEQYCKEVGYETLYLHTHKFLPGGYSFWQRQGFITTVDERDEIETVHLEKALY